MKIAYSHLIKYIPSNPSILDISEKLFQLGHEHEIQDNFYIMEFTPNRGDCLSLLGLLRDLNVFYEVNFNFNFFKDEIKPFEFNFINNAKNACPRISFLLLEISGKPKPYTGVLKSYFEDFGLNKNNLFTDVSNFVTYETGQPTHCYDAQYLDNSITLEYIDKPSKFHTLLDTQINLTGTNLVFTKDNKVINLAGVMGGMNSSCSPNTKSVVVECAFFNQDKIIGKSLKYDINSDAAYKFERGVDPLSHDKVLRRFIKLIQEYVNIDNVQLYKNIFHDFNHSKISVDVAMINKILGTSLGENDFINYIEKLGFEYEDGTIVVPSHRGDVTSQNDIAEEVARVIGYNNIPIKSFIPRSDIASKNHTNETLLRSNEQIIKSHLISYSFFEVINNPFIANKKENSIKIDNPLDSRKSFLRTTLKESLIKNLLYNERRQKDSIKLFEVSDIYFHSKCLDQKRVLGVICTGRIGRNYNDFSKYIDKKYLEKIFSELDTGHNIEISEIDRKELDTKIKSRIYYIEIELNNLNLKSETPSLSNVHDNNSFTKYNPISEYPCSIRDLSFSVTNKDGYQELQKILLNYDNDLIKEVFIFDFYVDTKKNVIKIGFRFIFESKESTITDIQVNNIVNDIVTKSLLIQSVTIPGLQRK